MNAITNHKADLNIYTLEGKYHRAVVVKCDVK